VVTVPPHDRRNRREPGGEPLTLPIFAPELLTKLFSLIIGPSPHQIFWPSVGPSTGLSSLDGNYLAPRHNISPYLSSSRSTTKLPSLPDWLNPIGRQFSKKTFCYKKWYLCWFKKPDCDGESWVRLEQPTRKVKKVTGRPEEYGCILCQLDCVTST